MKIYIAGKINGNPNYKADFQVAEDHYRSRGHIVLNPAILPEGMRPEQYMQICIPMIFAADWVMFLPGWETSEGAKLEYELCRYIGRPTLIYGEAEECMSLELRPCDFQTAAPGLEGGRGMTDYYSREAVAEFISSYRCSTDVAIHMEQHLNEIPAADVRPVVLCRDCKYWELSKVEPSFSVCTYVCGATFVRASEDFCSRGEKREAS